MSPRILQQFYTHATVIFGHLVQPFLYRTVHRLTYYQEEDFYLVRWPYHHSLDSLCERQTPQSHEKRPQISNNHTLHVEPDSNQHFETDSAIPHTLVSALRSTHLVCLLRHQPRSTIMDGARVKTKNALYQATLILYALSVFTTPAHAFFRNLCAGSIALARIDPIVSPGKPSQHLHQLNGGSSKHERQALSATSY